MLEEKNDNLSDEITEIDGSQEMQSVDANETNVQEIETNQLVSDVIPDTEVEAPIKPEEEKLNNQEIEDLVGEQISETPKEVPTINNTVTNESTFEKNIEEQTETIETEEIENTIEDVKTIESFEKNNAQEHHNTIEDIVVESANEELKTTEFNVEENTIVLTDEQVANDIFEVQENTNSAMNSIADVNAEESEDETLKARHEVEMLDYDSLPMEKLVDELEKLVVVEKVMSVKDHVEELKKAFLSKYYHFIDEKKDEFKVENPDSVEEFVYNFPLKTKFDSLYNQYRDTKNKHFKSLQNNLQTNLNTRLAIVEELKELVNNPNANITASLKQLNDIRERWKVAGAIPKDKYNHVWNNFHFHIENFYDFLHLDREARDIDFKHNLEQKQKIVSRVEELLLETDINKSFRELQDLHRIWKEDIGPVSREHREDIWIKFSDLTKQMHDKREAFYETFRASENENLVKKKEIIAQLVILSQEKVDSHAAWLKQIEKIDEQRNLFLSTGKVPSEVNEQTWAEFKNAVRDFNVLKNSFYKDIKKDQSDNLSLKQALVEKANALKDSEDFVATTPIMKEIQEEWKKIGHVPRKFSDVVWNQFKAACNHYFDRLKDSKKEENAEENEAFDKKKEYLENLKSFELVGDHKTDLDAIKLHIQNWKGFGRVPFNKRHIEGKFNKILDALFEKLSSSKKEGEMMRFANRIDNLADSDDKRKIDNEKIFIMRKIDEVQNEIFQLENNIQFFQNTKNAKKENSIVTEVRKNIERNKEDLATWKEKLTQLKKINQ